MQIKQSNHSDPTSIYGIDRVMPIDFIFLLLRLINYPDTEPYPFITTATRFNQLRFKTLTHEKCREFLLLLRDETGLGVVLSKDLTVAKIETTKQSAGNILFVINNYLNKFIKSKLRSIDGEYFKFEKQKDYFLDAIQKKIDSGIANTLSLYDSEMETGYNLFESLLILESQKYFKIENIYNCQNQTAKNYYKVEISINKRRFRVPLEKLKVPALPICTEEKGIGYLKFGTNGRKTKISRITSRPYKLLRCLTEPFGVAKPINLVYEALVNKKDATINNPYLALNIKIRKIEFTIKELQRIPEYSKNLKIHIDKERKIVWLERID